MTGWAYKDNKWVPTNDIRDIKAARILIANHLARMSDNLNDTSTDDEIDQVIKEINALEGYYNANGAILDQVARRDRIREIKAVMRQLNEPPDQSPAA